jgi:hypothetical protein
MNMPGVFNMVQALIRTTLRAVAVAGAVGLAGCSAPEMLVSFPSHPKGAEVAEYSFDLHQPSVHTFNPYDLGALVESQQRASKVDTLLVVLDTQGLKGRMHQGIDAAVYGQEVLRRFHRTLPSPSWRGQLFVTEASVTGTSAGSSAKSIAPAGTLKGADLAQSLHQLSELSVQQPGRVAVLVVTAWDRIDPAVEEAVMRMRQKHASASGLQVQRGESTPWVGKKTPGMCFYAVGVGNRHSRERLYSPDTCGGFWAADAVMQPAEMAAMGLEVLYDKAKDDDGDGIPNYLDQCAMTPAGRTVTSQGCLRFPGPEDRQPEGVK